jgi:hypothetical protein
MYCPKCRSEFREGFVECADCLVPLVENLPPEEPEPIPEYVDLEEVMTSFDIGEIAIAGSILDGHQMSYLVQGENFSTCYGCMPAWI